MAAGRMGAFLPKSAGALLSRVLSAQVLSRTFTPLGVAVACAAALVTALTFSNLWLLWRVGQLESEAARVRRSLNADLPGQIWTAAETADAARRAVDDLRAAVFRNLSEAQIAAVQAARSAESLAGSVTAEQRRISGRLGQIGASAVEAHAKASQVATDLQLVRGETSAAKAQLAHTQTELAKTAALLKSVRGDLGVPSGPVATNSRELAVLRGAGERDYHEFVLNRTGNPAPVGSVSILLKGTDPRRSRYTIDVVAGGQRFEKKDRQVNEPVQFYASKSWRLYEIVVNRVEKDQIAGYLAVPKLVQPLP